ncbi:hypothetical protein M501DRAFT_1007130 [Patellaria atrata CBS 101060]|uniref:WSC domain-containing protein n=1 Tax=Patellaria atrata CBS 101060 TaxID=1346257 RepID=A0A9P4VPK5_9PEZI|nr:hypothetical protein M501DRAFT_1007130 [Patellaria atrata CBS 101060]
MARHSSNPITMALGFALSLACFAGTAAAALTQKYCASDNTANNLVAAQWPYQSNGWCFENCKVGYAFAVVQGYNCWCSNYVPADQEDISKCSEICPGYGDELCGSTSRKLYGYIPLNRDPLVLAQPVPTTTEVRVSTLFSTVYIITSSTVPLASVPFPSSVRIKSTSSHRQSSWHYTASSHVSKPVSSSSSGASKSSPSTGTIVGAVFGALIGVAALVVGGICWLSWRKRSIYADNRQDPEGPAVRRTTSTMSRTGLLGRGNNKLPPIITQTNVNGLEQNSISPMAQRRISQPLFTDDRLNTTMLHENGSRTSFLSLPDNQDYGRSLIVTRPLNVASPGLQVVNPDPPESNAGDR